MLPLSSIVSNQIRFLLNGATDSSSDSIYRELFEPDTILAERRHRFQLRFDLSRAPSVGKDENYNMNRLSRAKAFVISVLGEFAETCQTKLVNLEAKVKSSMSIGRGLTHEAALLSANFLLVDGPKKPSQRSFFQITKYCFKHAPGGCSVIAIRKPSLSHRDYDPKHITYEENLSTSQLEKALPPFKKLFALKMKRDKKHSPTESIGEKSSPVAILDGPEGEEFFGLVSKETGRHSRNNIWRRLSIIKLLSPLFRSVEDLGEIDECSSNFEGQRPSWRCFSYEEIAHATNNFHQEAG